MTDENLMRLNQRDVEGIGILLIHQLNTLFGYSCCRRCCAPCSYLWDLAQDDDKLEVMISQAPPFMWQDWLYDAADVASDDPPGTPPYKPQVRERDGRLSRAWLESRLQGMDDEPCPNHEEVSNGNGV